MCFTEPNAYPRRELPKAFGNWNKGYKRFNVWSAAGEWAQGLQAACGRPDLECVFFDSSYAKAYSTATVAASNDEAIEEKSTQQDSLGGGRPWLVKPV